MSVNKRHKRQDGKGFKLYILKETLEYVEDGFCS